LRAAASLATVDGLEGLSIGHLAAAIGMSKSGLTFRQCGILVTAAASAFGDSYCSLAWGGKLGTASQDGGA